MGLLKETIIELNRPAILLGNGINLLENTFIDWKALLKKLGGNDIKFEGLTYNEIYNFIELKKDDDRKLKNNVALELQSPKKSRLAPHSSFIELMVQYDCPVLTTNFDLALETSKDLESFRITKKGFTRYYPWDIYSGISQLKTPIDGFGIWHIHGMTKYLDSIRLGLTDYMGSVERSRKWIHRGPDSLFRGKDQLYWPGKDSWLHIWFNMPLIIVGIKLETQEIFIRWLLIERERYFRKFEVRRRKTVFLSTRNDTRINNFLENLNIKHITTSSIDHYALLYS
ncbi:SIR2 family protein [Sediminicola luteus]|uniref:SIR2-like domain-containing protein n=1 Tax=Sediminicola luteus TaxID=319238 RepID=A0ABV2TX30_9FLAO